jgi:hypothetical protein
MLDPRPAIWQRSCLRVFAVSVPSAAAYDFALQSNGVRASYRQPFAVTAKDLQDQGWKVNLSVF